MTTYILGQHLEAENVYNDFDKTQILVSEKYNN